MTVFLMKFLLLEVMPNPLGAKLWKKHYTIAGK